MNKIEYLSYHRGKKSRYRANMKAWLEIKDGSDFTTMPNETSSKQKDSLQFSVLNSLLFGG
jgi:hypothetical protein